MTKLAMTQWKNVNMEKYKMERKNDNMEKLQTWENNNMEKNDKWKHYKIEKTTTWKTTQRDKN